MRQHRVDVGVLGARGRSADLRPCGCASHGRGEDTPCRVNARSDRWPREATSSGRDGPPRMSRPLVPRLSDPLRNR
jgi:hypothetical protein